MSKGYEGLLLGFTTALENNSKMICSALEGLASRKLSEKDMKELQKIKKELKKIDKEISSLE